jgi:hypothetical protein
MPPNFMMLTRQSLDDLVWSTPMSTLAKDFRHLRCCTREALPRRRCASPAARLLGPPGRWATSPNPCLIHPT